jgi:hypothetical protein
MLVSHIVQDNGMVYFKVLIALCQGSWLVLAFCLPWSHTALSYHCLQPVPLQPLDSSELMFTQTIHLLQALMPLELDQHESKVVVMMGKLVLSMSLKIDPLVEVETELCKCHTCEDCEGWCGSPRKFAKVLGRKLPQHL